MPAAGHVTNAGRDGSHATRPRSCGPGPRLPLCGGPNYDFGPRQFEWYCMLPWSRNWPFGPRIAPPLSVTYTMSVPLPGSPPSHIRTSTATPFLAVPVDMREFVSVESGPLAIGPYVSTFATWLSMPLNSTWNSLRMPPPGWFPPMLPLMTTFLPSISATRRPNVMKSQVAGVTASLKNVAVSLWNALMPTVTLRVGTLMTGTAAPVVVVVMSARVVPGAASSVTVISAGTSACPPAHSVRVNAVVQTGGRFGSTTVMEKVGTSTSLVFVLPPFAAVKLYVPAGPLLQTVAVCGAGAKAADRPVGAAKREPSPPPLG